MGYPRLEPSLDVFVGRQRELEQLIQALLPTTGDVRPVAVRGVPGVGKSSLVDRFAERHAAELQGGYVRLILREEGVQDEQDLIAELADRLNTPPGADVTSAVRTRLTWQKTLLHIDEANARSSAGAAMALARRLEGCTFVVSGCEPNLGEGVGWAVVEVGPLPQSDAMEQLAREHRFPRDATETQEHERLVDVLGGLPLAIHLAAALLRSGRTAVDLVEHLRAVSPDIGNASTLEGSKRLLQNLFELSLSHLEQALGSEGKRQIAGLGTLAYAPQSGVGESLGAALADPSAVDLDTLVKNATTLSLMEPVLERRGRGERAYRLHPYLAKLLRARTAEAEAVDRMAMWLVARVAELPRDQQVEQAARWREVKAETDTLLWWLSRVPPTHWSVLAWPWYRYAERNGPARAWMALCERVLHADADELWRSQVLGTLVEMAESTGEIERALAAAEEKRALAERRGDMSGMANAVVAIADIRQLQGDTDAALRALREEALPLFTAMNDRHGQAATIAKIADIIIHRGDADEALRLYHEAVSLLEQFGDHHGRVIVLGKIAQEHSRRGELDEALRLLREQVIPGIRSMGDTRSLAAFKAELAHVLGRRGNPDEALRLYREEVLPAFVELGDVRQWAAVRVRVADIIEHRGDTDEAMRIRREELLPIFEKIGDSYERAVTLGRIAQTLARQGEIEQALSIWREQLSVWDDRGDVRQRALTMRSIAGAIASRGQTQEALRIFRGEVQPVLERTGDLLELANTKGEMAHVLVMQGDLAEAERIRREEELPLHERVGDVRSHAAALLGLADILQARGELGEAFRILTKEAMPIIKKLGEKQPTVAVTSQLAGIALQLGKVEDTIQMCRETLPMARDVGHVQLEAKLIMLIADALAYRGDLHDALRTYRDDVLPIFHRLGDARSQAIINGRIADVSSRLGDTQEALRILRDTVLPQLEEVGDVDGRALAAKQMAHIFLERNDLDEALRLLTEEALPPLQRMKRLAAIDTQCTVGRVLLRRGRAGDRAQAYAVLREARADAERAGLTSAAVIDRMLRTPFLKSIRIHNFKNIDTLELSFENESDLPGHWTCVAGLNGAGKSALLQAIALVLLGDRLTQELGGDLLRRSRRRLNGTVYDAEITATVVRGDGEHEVALSIQEGGVDFRRAGSDPERYRAMSAFWDERSKEHVLLAYGAGRNLSEHIDTRHSDKSIEVRRQMTLFDPLSQVASAESLLAKGEAKAILPMLRRLLAAILKDTPIQIVPDEDALRFRIGETIVQAVDLPDGFRATVAWLADLCATWHAKAPDEARSGDPSEIRALLLIDELDLHFHASLQRAIVPQLRKALPEVQWIVTTHSPLVLSSFDRRELVLLETGPSGEARVRPPLDRQILGFSMDEVYRWLLEIPPRSAALDDRFRNGGHDADARLAMLLAQSPEVSEAEAEQDRAFSEELARKVRARRAEKDSPKEGR